MRKPPGPPTPDGEPPAEPFAPTRTPAEGVSLRLAPPPLPQQGRAVPPRLRPAEGAAERLERQLAGVRLELASFREWWPEQLATLLQGRPTAAVAAPAPPPLSGPGGRRRELGRALLLALAGALLALGLTAAALSWPAYGRAAAARLGACAASGDSR